MMKLNTKGTDIIHFRQWSRNGFGLFQVLGKIVKISFLMVAYILVAEPAEAQKELTRILAEEDTDVTLETVEVKGQRIATSLAEVARVVRVITQKEIAGSPYSSISDFLDQELSLDIRQRGQEGIQSDISIQGSTYEQVLVLINGIPLNNPQTGHFNGDIPVPLQAVERIEIISGGASRWLGPNAFAGAINIITRTASSERFKLKFGAGQKKLYNLSATKQFGNKNTHLLSVSHGQTEGYTQNTDSKSSKVFYHSQQRIKAVSLHSQIGVGIKKFGAQAFYTPVYPDQYEEINQGFASTGYTRSGKMSYSQDAYVRLHTDEFHLFRGESPSWYTGPNQHFSRSMGLINNLWWINQLGRITLGVDLKSEGVMSTVLGELLDTSKRLPFSETEYSNGAERKYVSFYGEQVYKKERLLIVAGLMANISFSDSVFTSFYPGIDLRYDLTKESNLFVSANRSLRMPSFTELYYSSPTNQGNKTLKPEDSWSTQLGYKRHTSLMNMRVNAFGSYGQNLIDWSKGPDDEKWKTRNLNELYRVGIEIETSWRPFQTSRWEKLSIRAGYRYVFLSKSSGDFDSRYVLDHLRHKAILSGNLPLTKRLHVNLQTRIQSRAGWYTDWDESGESYQQEYEPFILTDLKMHYMFNQFRIYTEILNLWNVDYADIGHVNQPGRWFRFGFELSLVD